MLPLILISRTKTRTDGRGSPFGACGTGGKSVPGLGNGGRNCSGSVGGSPGASGRIDSRSSDAW